MYVGVTAIIPLVMYKMTSQSVLRPYLEAQRKKVNTGGRELFSQRLPIKRKIETLVT